jgi:hypothetical protein
MMFLQAVTLLGIVMQGKIWDTNKLRVTTIDKSRKSGFGVQVASWMSLPGEEELPWKTPLDGTRTKTCR